MKIELSHVTDLGSVVDIHMYVSTKDNNNYFEKLFGLEKNGRYLVVHGRKEKSIDGSYPYSAFIEGTIYDGNGEVCVVSNRVFHDDDLTQINEWINEHEEEWGKYCDKRRTVKKRI